MKRFLHVFVLIAFLTGIIAPACGFAWGGKFSVVEICTAQGIEQKIVESDDEEQSPSAHEECLFCFQSANMNGFLPANIQPADLTIIQVSAFKRDALFFRSDFSFDHGARAPPLPLV